MKIIIFLLLLSMIMGGCSLFKNTSKTTEEKSQKVKSEREGNTASATSSIRNGKRIVFRKDSAQTGYTIRFWPKGELKFLPDEGFAGEFDSIWMQGNQKRVTGLAETLNTMEQESGKTTADFKEAINAKSSQGSMYKKSSPDIKSIIIIVCMLSVLFLWLLRRKIFQ